MMLGLLWKVCQMRLRNGAWHFSEDSFTSWRTGISWKNATRSENCHLTSTQILAWTQTKTKMSQSPWVSGLNFSMSTRFPKCENLTLNCVPNWTISNPSTALSLRYRKVEEKKTSKWIREWVSLTVRARDWWCLWQRVIMLWTRVRKISLQAVQSIKINNTGHQW